MVKLKIKVTEGILKKSKHCGKNKKTFRFEETNCAIALAVRDIFPKAYVEGSSVYFDSELDESGRVSILRGIGISAKLPPLAQDFIENFDFASPFKRVKMAPIEFEIKVPNCVIEKINIDELRPLLENHPTLELVPRPTQGKRR